jgi:kynureninase
MRFGFTPLYVRPEDVEEAARRLGAIIRDRLWDRPEFKARSKVT